jgi:hypothetical protein
MIFLQSEFVLYFVSLHLNHSRDADRQIHHCEDLQWTSNPCIEGCDVFAHLESGLVVIHCEDQKKYGLQVGQTLDLTLVAMAHESGGPSMRLPEHETPAAQMVAVLSQLVLAARKKKCPQSLWLRSRSAAKTLYNDVRFQILIAFVLVANLCVNAYEAQMHGKPNATLQVLTALV